MNSDKVIVNSDRFSNPESSTINMSNVKVGSKVRSNDPKYRGVNLIAIVHDSMDNTDVWICVDPNNERKPDHCRLYFCFEDELTIGWE